ncbi:MAG: hypothetical protein DPW12_00845 [Rhodocyclaceae bacterium]|nr:hypothetical protein [Rhodocyclaceae bacterium]
MATTVLIVFLVVYLGMFLGELLFLQIDRTGIALLGAIALAATWAVIAFLSRGRWTLDAAPPPRREEDAPAADDAWLGLRMP